jgi:hypothetical protein
MSVRAASPGQWWRSEQRANVFWNGDRIDQDQPLAVVDCAGRHWPFPFDRAALGEHF